jgi:hypothetical protein
MQVPSGLGAPVAANRGASGIDGVLSSAAGFAFGLNRGVTLLVGDISFLHDINGLSLLRSGALPLPCRPAARLVPFGASSYPASPSVYVAHHGVACMRFYGCQSRLLQALPQLQYGSFADVRIGQWESQSLLATGEMRPPLTVVLINNSGGGIFSFLPIANDVDEDVFAQLWSTPQNVDLAGTHFQHMLAIS